MCKKVIVMVVTILLLAASFSGIAFSEKEWAESVDVIKQGGKEIGLDSVIFRGHTYQIFYDKCSWEIARNACEELGGHLLTITSKQEQAFVELYLTEVKDADKSFWIGITNTNNNWEWTKWITGEKVVYTNWASGNPDKNWGDPGYGRIAADSYPEDNGWVLGRGFWDDEDDNYYKIKGYICEWDTDEVVIDNVVDDKQEIATVIEKTDETVKDNKNGEMQATSYDNEILFRSIPWGTSMASIERMKIFDYLGVYDSSMPFEENMKNVPSWRLSLGSGTEFKTGHCGIGMVYGEGLKVGGFIVNQVYLYCMYGVDDGVLNRGKEASQLIAADYVFEPVDYQATYYALQGKLNDLYGAGDVKEETADSYFLVDKGKFDYIQHGVTTVWNGANDTHVILFGSWIEDEVQFENDINDITRNLTKNLYITYYKGGLDQQLKYINTLEQELEKKEEMENSTGNDGL